MSSHEPSARKNLKPSPVSSGTVRAIGLAREVGRRLAAQVDQQAPLRLGVGRPLDVDVDPQVERRPGELVEVLDRARHRPAPGRPLAQEQVEQQQVRVDAVALGQVHPEPEAARLLGAHHRPGLDHLRADELEPDRRLVGRDPVVLAEPRRHRRVVDADHDRLAPAAMLREVVHQQAGHLELVEERAALVGRAGPVGVAVEQQAEVVAARGEDPERLVDVRADRLRVDAAEERVALLVDLVDAEPPAGQQPRQPAAPGAPHRVDQDRRVGRLERVEVDGPPDEPLVALERVEPLDEPGRLRVGERPPLEADPAVLREPAPR